MTAGADHAEAAVRTEPSARSRATARQSRHLAARRTIIVAAVSLMALEMILGWSWLASAADAIVGTSWQWALVAAMAAFASMVCFGAVRQRTAHAAGVEVHLHQALSLSYASGALHITLPGGAVFSTAYAFRELRRWGASTTVATWCMAITGVLATATLALVGLIGAVVGSGFPASGTSLMVEIGCTAIVIGLVVFSSRHPEALLPTAKAGLRLLNRIRRRPPRTGGDLLTTMITDLAAIRPSSRQWALATVLSLANWVFDAACLWACCCAVGVHITLPAVLLTYTAGMAAVSLSPLPAGIGIVEGALAVGLTAAGAATSAALAAVLVYRLISVGSVAVVGWLILAANPTPHRPAPDHRQGPREGQPSRPLRST